MKFWFIVSLFVLSSCGGSGGSDASGGGSENKGPTFDMTFSPSGITEQLIESQATSWQISANVSITGEVTNNLYIFVIDNNGLISEDVSIVQQSESIYELTLRTKDDLASGDYIGNITVKLCKDINCSSEHSGSPWSIPIDVKVESHTNLTPLTAITNYNGWQTYQSNNAHTGYIPVVLDPNKFTLRWLWKSDENTQLYKGAVANGSFFTIENKGGLNENDRNILAISEETGSLLWQEILNSELAPSGITINEDTVILSRLVDGVGQHYSGYDTALGSLQFDFYINSYTLRYAPLVNSGQLFYAGIVEQQLSLSSVNLNSETTNWATSLSKEFPANYVPAFFNDSIYYYDSGLVVLDNATGSITANIPDSNVSNNNLDYTSPVVAENGNAIILTRGLTPRLSVYDVANQSLLWSLENNYIHNPITDHESVYTTSLTTDGSQDYITVDSLSLITGANEWSKNVSIRHSGVVDITLNMLVTDNILFLSTSENVFAINIDNQEVIWNYPFGGKLSLSENGVLYIERVESYGDSTNKLAAVNVH